MSQDDLGDRMKLFESVPRTRLIPQLPIVIRLDGRAFHTFTRGMQRPYDRAFNECMWEAARCLTKDVAGCRLAYVQSDEITLVLTTSGRDSQAWFDGQVQKMVSVSSSLATGAFIRALVTKFPDRWSAILESGRGIPSFDSRCWNIPEYEIPNVLIWRQQDASRNSVSTLAQANFSHKRLHGVSSSGMQDLLMLEKGINWNDCPTPQKRGVCLVKRRNDTLIPEEFRKPDGPEICIRTSWEVDEDIPIFTTPEGKAYIDRQLQKENVP